MSGKLGWERICGHRKQGPQVYEEREGYKWPVTSSTACKNVLEA